jgi:hypothetical protein
MEPNLYEAMRELRQALEPLSQFRQQGFYSFRCDGIDRKSQESPALCDLTSMSSRSDMGSSLDQAGAQNSWDDAAFWHARENLPSA